MKLTNALAIAAVLAVAAVLGVAAATKTATLGATSKKASETSLVARTHKLDAFEASLRKALKSKPPALPKVPAADAATPPPAARPAAAPRVIYQRPAPIIVHKARAHGDEEHESEGGDDDGGERDD